MIETVRVLARHPLAVEPESYFGVPEVVETACWEADPLGNPNPKVLGTEGLRLAKWPDKGPVEPNTGKFRVVG